jgi:hypothetical protein
MEMFFPSLFLGVCSLTYERGRHWNVLTSEEWIMLLRLVKFICKMV